MAKASTPGAMDRFIRGPMQMESKKAMVRLFIIFLKGEINFPSGKKFKGQFVNGQVHGQGVFI